MKKTVHLVFWPILVVLFSSLAWLSVSLLEFDHKSREEQQKQKLNEQVRLCLWRMDSSLSHFLFDANKGSPKDFTNRLEMPVSDAADNYAAAYFEIEHDPGIPFAPAQHEPLRIGNTAHVSEASRITLLADEIKKLGINRTGEKGIAGALPLAMNTSVWDNVTRDSIAVGNYLPNIQQSTSDYADYGVWIISSRHIPWKESAPLFYSPGLAPDQNLNETILYKTTFAPRWIGDDLVLTRLIETPWRTFTQAILLDQHKLTDNLLALTRDILPDAVLSPYKDADIKTDHVTRLLAGLPLIINPGMPLTPYARQTSDTLKMSLMLIWGAALIAVGGIAALLFGMMRLNERRSMFVSTVTHELRTPLTTLDMYAEMLMYGFVSPHEYKEYFASMRQESGRLRRLIDNVLGFSRIERSIGAYKVSAISGKELSKHIMACIAPIIKRSGMHVSFSISDEASHAEVMANKEAVCQMMGNLADNAVKYALKVPGSVFLDISVSEGFWEITFQDSGPGIPPRVSKKLFKPFSRPSTGEKSGMGLGLYLSKSMAKKMGGNLRFDPTLQPGAGFRLTLPLKKPYSQ